MEARLKERKKKGGGEGESTFVIIYLGVNWNLDSGQGISEKGNVQEPSQHFGHSLIPVLYGSM